jgi:hypothetical protein
MSDLAEVQAGTNPTDRTIQTVPGRCYQHRPSSDLDTWKNAGMFKAADWPAGKTLIIIPAVSLPPDSQQKLFIQVGPSP